MKGNYGTKDLVLPAGMDAATLATFSLQDGTTYAEVAEELQMVVNGVNNEIYNTPWIAGLVTYTDDPSIEYASGNISGFTEYTEYSRADNQKSELSGHMLPKKGYDLNLGWTWLFLKNAQRSKIESSLEDVVTSAKTLVRQTILNRVLSRSDEAVGSGYSTGFATAAANTSVDFTPRDYGGNTFDSDHEHYVAVDTSGAPTVATFQAAKKDLTEHGHSGPMEFLISEVQESVVRGLTGFVPAPDANVVYGESTNVANFSTEVIMGSYYIGVLEGFRVRVVTGMPQYYGFGYKSYGANSARNPIAIRLDKGKSRPEFIAMKDPKAGNGTSPIQDIMIYTELGVGVNDRTNGTTRYFNSDTWANGTAG
jgi:hypothetical protein